MIGPILMQNHLKGLKLWNKLKNRFLDNVSFSIGIKYQDNERF